MVTRRNESTAKKTTTAHFQLYLAECVTDFRSICPEISVRSKDSRGLTAIPDNSTV